jgi:ABC-type multidrug transport system fused ATPase/permease subunit
MVFAGINMSNNITKNIIRNLLNASFTKFYNRVLTGRIMNRLSKDIYSIDATLTDVFILFSIFFVKKNFFFL